MPHTLENDDEHIENGLTNREDGDHRNPIHTTANLPNEPQIFNKDTFEDSSEQRATAFNRLIHNG